MSSNRRPYGTGSNLVPVQGRVSPDTRDAMRARATELGISVNQYIDELIQIDLAEKIVPSHDSDYTQERLSA